MRGWSAADAICSVCMLIRRLTHFCSRLADKHGYRGEGCTNGQTWSSVRGLLKTALGSVGAHSSGFVPPIDKNLKVLTRLNSAHSHRLHIRFVAARYPGDLSLKPIGPLLPGSCVALGRRLLGAAKPPSNLWD
ncbi:hypothetical protein FQA47_003749 [Oryzias melastigma]|uniref:Uncharacterized protein n=1 Tax=Oryzias melastigma TaxID=30732 RepID=A0A834C908_ORYME|nr:hypothetical protein FQA47_003749 [Oryzias melastigma]